MLVAEGGQVKRQLGAEACALKTPVFPVLMAGLQAAYDQIAAPCAVQDAESVNKGDAAEGTDLPVSLFLWCCDYDFRLCGIVGRIKPVCGKELAVRAGNLCHGHDSAGLGPDSIQLCAVLGKKVTGILLFGSDKKAVFPLIRKFGYGIAFV